MVDAGGQAHRRGFSDALTGDPLVEAAAIAVLHGADPIEFLRSDSHEEWAIRCAAYRRAEEISAERRVAELKAIAAGSAMGAANTLARAFK